MSCNCGHIMLNLGKMCSATITCSTKYLYIFFLQVSILQCQVCSQSSGLRKGQSCLFFFRQCKLSDCFQKDSINVCSFCSGLSTFPMLIVFVTVMLFSIFTSFAVVYYYLYLVHFSHLLCENFLYLSTLTFLEDCLPCYLT